MPDSDLADNSVLTSAFYNTYIRDQVVVQCTSATRPTGVEGRLIYETDTDRLMRYNGSNWTGLISDALESAIYTPSLSNVAIGTGGGAENTARYTFVGDQGAGQRGIITISTSLVLGSSGSSVSGPPTLGLPSGFEFQFVTSSATFRLGLVTLATSIGAVQWNSSTTFAYTALNAASTYLAVTAVSATVPVTWAAGNVMRAVFSAQVVRV